MDGDRTLAYVTEGTLVTGDKLIILSNKSEHVTEDEIAVYR